MKKNPSSLSNLLLLKCKLPTCRDNWLTNLSAVDRFSLLLTIFSFGTQRPLRAQIFLFFPRPVDYWVAIVSWKWVLQKKIEGELPTKRYTIEALNAYKTVMHTAYVEITTRLLLLFFLTCELRVATWLPTMTVFDSLIGEWKRSSTVNEFWKKRRNDMNSVAWYINENRWEVPMKR